MCFMRYLHVCWLHIENPFRICLWFLCLDTQGLRSYSASVFHVGLGYSVALRGFVLLCEKTTQFKTRTCVFLSGSLEPLLKLSSACVAFLCKKVFPRGRLYMCFSSSFVLGDGYFLEASLLCLSLLQFPRSYSL